jgi:hypothetical protein
MIHVNDVGTMASFISRTDNPTLDLSCEAQKMIRYLSIIAVLGLAGCATSSNTYLKNGKQGLSIDCSGEAMSWASCYEKADASCAGTGYEIVGTDGTPQPRESDKTLGVDVGNYKSRSVLVVCK